MTFLWMLINGLIILYVQLLIMPALEVFGIIPNLLLPWSIFLLWRKPFNLSCIILFVIGLLYDSTMPYTMGMNTLVFMIIVFFVDFFRKPFEKDSLIALGLTILLSNLIYNIFVYSVYGFIEGFNLELFQQSLLSFLINLSLSCLVIFILMFISKLQIVIRHE